MIEISITESRQRLRDEQIARREEKKADHSLDSLRAASLISLVRERCLSARLTLNDATANESRPDQSTAADCTLGRDTSGIESRFERERLLASQQDHLGRSNACKRENAG